MPTVEFSAIPDSGRAWVFGSNAPVTGERASVLLGAVDAFLAQWAAHGAPLTCARDWRDDRFLVIAVNESSEGASGCSIDGLFRVLGALESEIGASLRGSGRVYYRDAAGDVTSVTRAEFRRLAAEGVVAPETTVFDITVTTAGDVRSKLEAPASHGWHAQLLSVAKRS